MTSAGSGGEPARRQWELGRFSRGPGRRQRDSGGDSGTLARNGGETARRKIALKKILTPVNDTGIKLLSEKTPTSGALSDTGWSIVGQASLPSLPATV